MADTIIIASKVAMPFAISEPNPNPEKPGDAPPLRSFVINGARHPDGVGQEGITADVPADLYRAWVKANPNHPAITAGLLREVSQDDLDAGRMDASEFGFEPGLDRAKADSENNAKAAEGSKITGPGPVPAKDMATTSDAPADDTPRSVPGVNVGKPAKGVEREKV